MAGIFRFCVPLIALAVLSFSGFFCDLYASRVAFKVKVGRLLAAFWAPPETMLELTWRRQIATRRTPQYARTMAFMHRLASRSHERRHGPPLNAGLASCSLA